MHEKLQYPFAVGVGFLSHRILGPFLLRHRQEKSRRGSAMIENLMTIFAVPNRS